MNFKPKPINVYERRPNNSCTLLLTVPDQDAWESLVLSIKGKELIAVRGEIIDSTYTKTETEGG